jgi:hypothetical protein
MAKRHGCPRGCRQNPVSSALWKLLADGEAGGGDAKTESASYGRKAEEWTGKNQTPSGNDDRHTVCPCGVMKAPAFGQEPPVADHVNSVIAEAGLQQLNSQDCACG